MGVSPVGDAVSRALQIALDGAAERQRVVAANIANAATPHYRAREVSFEDSLAAAVDGGDPGAAVVSAGYADTPADAQGNTVDLQQQLTEQSRTGVLYEALAQAASYKMSVVRAAIH
jgi:flagellar basal-body rod protein FlgB